MAFVKLNTKKFLSIDFKHKHNNCSNCMVIGQLSSMLESFYGENLDNESLLTKKRTPYIIGINGSVCSGKSYIAEEIKKILKCSNPQLTIALLSTDNFIHTNKKLIKMNKFAEKGFTSSYDWALLFKTLKKIKKNKEVKTPYYSQDASDIHKTKKLRIPANVDILIIEGINLLKTTCNTSPSKNLCRKLLLSDYIDYTIYLETPEKNLKKWFYSRLVKKKTMWRKKKIKSAITRKTKREFKKFSNKIWDTYNSSNLKTNINPFRHRSDLIIHINKTHQISILEFKI